MNSALPACLVAYRETLEDAVRRDLRRTNARRRRGLVLRSALAAGVVAAVALGALSLVSRHDGRASVVDRAAAAVAPSPGTILHVDMLGSQTNGDGSVITWRDDSWQQQSPPYDGRKIETAPDGSVVETATADGQDQLYDAARNTIFVSERVTATPDELNSFDLEPGPRPGTSVLRMPGRAARAKGAHLFATVVITAKQAAGLRKGTDVIGFTLTKQHGTAMRTVTVIPAPKQAKAARSRDAGSADVDPTSSGFRGQILALLRSGEARVVGHATIDGQDTIEIASADGHTTYFVDPGSYRPVELRTRGTEGGTALRFRTYERLAIGSNTALLSLAAQHPDAHVDRDPAHYRAAEARLFPRG
jgi:hypothetical protein